MDADGEDDPACVPALLDAVRQSSSPHVIFGGRSKRSEGPLFSIFYALYRLLFRLMTGRSIQFGNFCAVPAPLLPKIVALSEIWNHFAAGVVRARIPYEVVRFPRGKRL